MKQKYTRHSFNDSSESHAAFTMSAAALGAKIHDIILQGLGNV